MTVPAATVRSLCTESEAALVRASRKPGIDELSRAELKRLAVRARKLFDKWNALARAQARTKSQQTGLGDKPQNTQRKAEIFREAVEKLEARLAQAEAAAGGTKRAKPKTKKSRAAEHRATRAAVRKGLTVAEDLVNSTPRKRR